MIKSRDETMERKANDGAGKRRNGWRIAGWSLAAAILLFPLVAMQFTDEVVWTLSDFVFMAVLLLAVGIPLELVLRKGVAPSFRYAAGLALVTAFLLIWLNAAVGIIGSEDNDVNLLYGGVLAIAVVGALIARFRPRGMARAMFATALAQASVAVGAIIAGVGSPASGPIEIILLNGFFVALWLGSALLFRNAAKGRTPADAKAPA